MDDEADITTLFHEALRNIQAVSILTFNDPVRALEHFTKNKKEYVLVLSDYKMPDLNGLDLLRKSKAIKPNVRTLLMSAFDVGHDHLLQKYLIEEIINEFIQKPITISHLCNKVNNQLQAYELASNGN